MSHTISRTNLNQLAAQSAALGKVLVGLVEADGRCFFRRITNPEMMILDPVVRPVNSVKEFVFPQSETICLYRHDGKELTLTDAEPDFPEQIIFGARPCDAASLPILDHVFGWDYKDPFYQQRRNRTVVITLACKDPDNDCFCTSVGLAPDSQAGADAMLLQIGEDFFEVRCFTEKGKAFFRGFTEESDEIGQTAEPPAAKFNARQVRQYLQTHFAEEIFDQSSLRCVGCGACTYFCPTCHCFDIVDEGGAEKGRRIKNWDACQFTMFTLHASGHNPRPDQSSRQRNRVQHKFNVYPEKFGTALCTGCGNCSRACPASLGVLAVLQLLDQKVSAVN